MSFEEEFDSIIRRKAEEEKYPFDENNWEKTSTLLNAERKATRASKLKQMYLPAVLVVAIGAAGFMAFNYFTTANAGGITDRTQVQNPAAAGISPAVSESKVTSLNSDNSFTGENVTTLPSGPENPAVVNTAKPLTAQENLTEKAERADNVITQAKTSDGQQTKSDVAVKSSVSTDVPDLQDANTASSEPAPAAGNQSHNGTNGQEFQGSLPPSGEENSVVQNAAPMQNTGTEKPEQTVTQPESAAGVINETETVLTVDYLGAVYSTLPFEITESDLVSTPFVYLDRYDDDYYENGKKPKTYYLNVEAGASYLLGWNALNGKDGAGLNWYAGFNYGRYLSRKISISAGLQAYNISNINQPFYLVASKEYGFGSKYIYTRVTSNQLYYVALPLKFNYAVNSTNSIGLGVNAGYLVGAENTVSKYYLLDNEEKSIGSSELHNKGVYKGTNRMNVMLSAHYKAQFCNRLGLNLEFNYGLTDIFGNMSGIKTSEMPVGIRLGLVYTLLDK